MSSVAVHPISELRAFSTSRSRRDALLISSVIILLSISQIWRESKWRHKVLPLLFRPATSATTASFFAGTDMAVRSAEDTVATSDDPPAKNLFDCSGVNASCMYFEPEVFFSLGHPGYPYRSTVESYWNVTYSDREELFFHTIKMDVGVYAYLEWTDNATLPPNQLPRSMIGVHIHKCGGSTVGSTFRTAARKFPSYELTLFYGHNLRAKYGNDWGPSSIELNKRAMRSIENDQKSGKVDNVVFSFVREPVGRFLSSVGEFLHSRNKKRKICLKPTTKEMLLCMIETLKTEGLQLDQHFAPASVGLFMTSLLGRPKISLLPMGAIPDFRDMFGLSNTVKKSAVSSTSYSGYNLTLSHLDQDMLTDICRLYEVDVVLMRSLGIETELCDPIIPVQQ